jgi:hypothetical protein
LEGRERKYWPRIMHDVVWVWNIGMIVVRHQRRSFLYF